MARGDWQATSPWGHDNCVSEVIDISPGNLDSSLCFIQPSILHDVLCIEVKWAGWQYTALTSVQSLSRVWLFATPWTAACQASLSITNSWSLLKLMSIESVMPSSGLLLGCPLLLPSIFPSIRVFSSESVLCIRWPKYWSFSFMLKMKSWHSPCPILNHSVVPCPVLTIAFWLIQVSQKAGKVVWYFHLSFFFFFF